MSEFTVKWEMTLDADTAEEAARTALAIHRDPESLATHFEVISKGNDVRYITLPIGEKSVSELQRLTNLRSTYFHHQTLSLNNNDQETAQLFGRMINRIDADIWKLQPVGVTTIPVKLHDYQQKVIDQLLPKYTLECFDGRFFKWDGFVLDTISDDGVDIATLSIAGEKLKSFHCPIAGYENDQETYLNDMLSTAKKWIDEQDLPAILQEQNA